ncbi:MAG TPA: response regulator [Chthonomonadaceae bacterium]|nr:response regulator [Chthonomonadaceae bacterium]
MSQQADSSASLRILVVEDEALLAEELQQRLTHMGYQVVGIADTAQGAIEAAERMRPDLVLMDIQLKGETDGIEAADHIYRRLNIPIVHLTAHSDRATLQRAKATTPFGYVLKPFHERDLQVAIEMAFPRFQRERIFSEQLKRLHEITLDLSHIVSPDDLCRQAVERLRSDLDFDRCSIWLYNDDSTLLTGTYGTDEQGKTRDERGQIWKLRDPGRLVFHNEGVPINIRYNVPLRDDRNAKVGRGWVATVALRDGATLIGVLSVDNLLRQLPLQNYQIELLGLYGSIVAHLCIRKRAEAALRQKQRMESLGQLAGGIAHDFNNLLTAISGYTELAQMEIAANTQAAEFLTNVQAAAERAAGLTRQLLTYARRQVVEFRSVNLHEVITGLAPLLHRTIGEMYELIYVAAEPVRDIYANNSQLEQVLLNLVINARDAMPHGGRIVIETANVTLEGEYTAAHIGVTPGKYVMLAVSDTGIGMTPEVQERIFEPFFTTKEIGKGTGLGLATSYGIVKKCNGAIRVESAPGQGTRFTVYLPEFQGASLPENIVAPMDHSTGTETILLVDDEPMVRDVTSRILQKQGYRVLEASSGPEAMQRYGKRLNEVDLLMTDVVMPTMSGKELAQRLTELHSELKVLYVSGYTQHIISQQGVLEVDHALLTKPFSPGALLQKVREVLNAYSS